MTISWEATAASSTCEEVRARVEAGYLERDVMNAKFERWRGEERLIGEEEASVDSLYDDHTPSTAEIQVIVSNASGKASF